MFVKGIRIGVLIQHRERSKKQGFRPLTTRQYFTLVSRILGPQSVLNPPTPQEVPMRH